MTNIYLSPEQIAILQELKDRGPNEDGNYSDVYALIASWLPDGDVKLWFRGATHANAGNGSFSTLIREYSKIQMELRGIAYSDALMQEASNRVAERVLEDILNAPVRLQTTGPYTGWYILPDIDDIADNDAIGVGEILFSSLGSQDTAGENINAAWSGTILFSAFIDSNQMGRLLAAGDAVETPVEATQLNTLDDLKNILFAYYAYKKAVIHTLQTSGDALLVLDYQLWVDVTIGFALAPNIIFTKEFDALVFHRLSNLLPPDAQPLGRLIEQVGVDQVLVWVMSSYTGEIVASDEASFGTRAGAFFNVLFDAHSLQNTPVYVSANAKELGELAFTDVHARVALAGMSPIVIEVDTDVAARFSLYNPETGEGHITEQWIEDRTRALSAYMTYWQRGETDGVLSIEHIYGSFPFPVWGDTIFGDAESGQSLTIDGLDFGIVDPRYISFGSAGNDVLTGGSRDDRLYGGDGADSLSGGADNDYLEGGIGNDTLDGGEGNDTLIGGAGNDQYLFTGNFGNDRIIDSDGVGSIAIGSQTMNSLNFELVRNTDNIFRDEEEQYQIVRIARSEGDYTLLISRMDDANSNQVRVENWQSGQLGIVLNDRPAEEPEEPEPVVPSFIMQGDEGANNLGIPYYYSLYESFLGVEYYGGEGNDNVMGTAKDDLLIGGEGDDWIMGQEGKDSIYGGEGHDFISFIDEGAVAYGEGGNDIMMAGYMFGFNMGLRMLDLGSEAEVELTYVFDEELLLHHLVGRRLLPNIIWSDLRQYFMAPAFTHFTTQEDDGWTLFHHRIWTGITPGIYAGESSRGDGWTYRFTIGGPEPFENDVTLTTFMLQGFSLMLFYYHPDVDDPYYGMPLNSLNNAIVFEPRQLPEGMTPEDFAELEYATLDGGDGDDLLYGWDARDTLIGGSGNDWLEGKAGNDLLDGGLGNDIIMGGEGNDTLLGGDGDDAMMDAEGNNFFYGGAGNDRMGSNSRDGSGWGNSYLDGGEGNDTLHGGNGNDTLIGGTGLDRLYGNEGNDVLDGGEGDDSLSGGDGDDFLDGGAGNDTLWGGNGNDILLGGIGNDSLTGEEGNDFIDGGEGDDSLWGSSGNDTLVGKEGNDDLSGGDGNDFLDGGEDDDNLWGGAGNDTLIGGAGRDALQGEEGNDFLDGGAGDNRLWGGAGNDTLLAGNGNDYLSGDAGNDYLDGGAGNDTLLGGAGNDTLIGGAGLDYLDGGDGDDTYIFHRGDASASQQQGSSSIFNSIIDQQGNNTLVLSGWSDVQSITTTSSGNHLLLDLGGGDRIQISNGLTGAISTIQFSTDASAIASNRISINSLLLQTLTTAVNRTAATARTELTGGKGNDTLIGHVEGSVFEGGEGNDVFQARGGENFYHMGLGDGRDSIQTSGAIDTIVFGRHINSPQITLSRTGADLVLSLASGESLTVSGMFNTSTGALIEDRAVENIHFYNGEVWGLAHIRQVLLRGTDGAETITGFDADDVIEGGKGNDALRGMTGDDTYVYNLGDGDDSINDTAGTDSIALGEGITPDSVRVIRAAGSSNLEIQLENGARIRIQNFTTGDGLLGAGVIEAISFADGTVWNLSSIMSRAVTGSNGNDTFAGFATDDYIVGGMGNDSLQGESGNDTYYFERGHGRDTIYDHSGYDVIQFGEGILAADVVVRRDGTRLSVQLNSGEQLTVNDMFTSSGSLIEANAIEAIQFANGDAWTLPQILVEMLRATDKHDLIYASSANDVLNGGRGSDIIYGGDGDDAYLFNRGDGIDTINDSGGTDRLIFGEGITPDDVMIVVRSPADRTRVVDFVPVEDSAYVDMIFLTTGGDRITVTQGAVDPNQGIEFVEFANGVVWDRQAMEQRIALTESRGDVLIGSNTWETLAADPNQPSFLTGLSGADYLVGSNGNDRLVSASQTSRTQILDGRGGADSFFVFAGRSSVTSGINESRIFIRGFRDADDRLFIDPALTPSDFNVSFVPYSTHEAFLQEGSLYFWTNSSTEEWRLELRSDNLLIIFDNLFSQTRQMDWAESNGRVYNGTQLSGTDPVGTIAFADGTLWTYETLMQMVLNGNDHNNRLYGMENAELLQGGAGNDSIYAFGGNDTLIGGTGNDYLRGGIGNDEYHFALGDGRDVIYEEGGIDRIVFAPGINPSDVSLLQTNYGGSNHGLMLYLSQHDSITISHYFVPNTSQGVARGLEYVEFADGTLWDLREMTADLNSHEEDTTAPELYTAEFDLTGGVIFGSAEAGSRIEVRAADSRLLASGSADLNSGSFFILLSTPVINSESIHIFAIDNAGNSSAASIIIAPDRTAPNAPAANISTDGITVSGTAEAASVITVRNQQGDILGSTQAQGNGAYELVLNAAVVTGELLSVTAMDSAANESVFTPLLTPDLTAPDAPSAAINLLGYQISGIAEPGSIVYVTNGTQVLGTAAANTSSGAYSVILDEGYRNGQQFQIYAADPFGNISTTTLLTAFDTTAPLAPVGHVSPEGTSVSGSAESISFIHVYDSEGTLIGSSQADEAGQYTVSLAGSYVDGEGLSVSATDASNNRSLASVIFAPDLTPPRVDIDFVHQDFQLGDSRTIYLRFSEAISELSLADFSVSGGNLADLTAVDDKTWTVIFTAWNVGDAEIALTSYTDNAGHQGIPSSFIFSVVGNDMTVLGGPGSDLLVGTPGEDLLIGRGGNDVLNGQEGNDTYRYFIGDGEDRILESQGQDRLELGSGIMPEDVSITTNGTDVIFTFAPGGRITVSGMYDYEQRQFVADRAVESVHFFDGRVWTLADIETRLLAALGNLYLGTSANNSLTGTSANDILVGAAGNDNLNGQGGDDEYHFARGDGTDRISDSGGNDRIVFAEGILPEHVLLRRSSSSLEISLDTGERITAQSFFNSSTGAVSTANVIEQIFFADGTVWGLDDVLQGIIEGTAVTDTIYGSDQHEVIDGGAGNDSLYGAVGNDSMFGGEGNDYLSGDDGDDVLEGGEGNDRLYGGNGNDILVGGLGQDSLYGGAGDDTLRGGGSDGDSLSGDAGNDVYLYGLEDGNVTISNLDTGAGRYDRLQFLEGISISNLRAARSSNNLLITVVSTGKVITVSNYFTNDGYGGYALDAITLADGTVADIEFVKQVVLYNTPGNDSLYGYATDDAINGGAGDDWLYGYGGQDLLEGGSGLDRLYGGDGDDTLLGGEGNDNLSGENGNDSLQGGSGNDNLSGGAGNDTLYGGGGNDTLSGDAGNDIYLYGLGDGNLIINNLDTGAGRHDVLQFLEGISINDLRANRSINNLVITVVSTGHTITVNNYFINDGFGGYALDAISFADGAQVDLEFVKRVVQYNTTGNDTLYGYGTSDSINGDAGNDLLYGYAGNDLLQGGQGNDTLYGGLGEDTLVGDAGNDYLSGEDGNDIYRFNRGDGQDTIREASGVDAIEFGPDIAPEHIQVRRRSGDLLLTLDSGESIAVQSMFNTSTGAISANYQVEEIRFSNGIVWNLDNIQQFAVMGSASADLMYGFDGNDLMNAGDGNDTLYGGAGNDSLLGGAGNDNLSGEDGDDVLEGGEGNDNLNGGNGNDWLIGGLGRDTLYGGAGNDTLRGGGDDGDSLSGDAGNDVYLYGLEDGNVTISNHDTAAGRYDVLQFLEGISISDIRANRSGNNLQLTLQSTGKVITVSNFFLNDGLGGYALDAITFADGTVGDLALVKEVVLYSTSGNDSLYGYASADTISGDAGNDLIYGYGGNDFLQGGIGNDSIYGGDDHDTLIGNAGNDYLDGGAGDDIYRFNRGDGQDTIREASGVDAIEFGPDIAPEHIQVRRSSTNLILTLDTGDSITVQSLFNSSTGALSANYLVEEIRFSNGTVWTLNDIQVLAVTGSSGADSLYGFDGNDVLTGGDGNDRLYGVDGNDTLIGGMGNDSLEGGSGDDIYRFNRGEGQDTVRDTAGNDSLQFGQDISADQLWFTRTGSNLQVSVIGTTDSVLLSSWYQGAANQVETITLADGSILGAAQVDNLVQAMAAFSPPPMGEIHLSDTYRTALDSVIAANWQ